MIERRIRMEVGKILEMLPNATAPYEAADEIAEAVMRIVRDSDGTASAALCEDIAVPKNCQARAEGIAQEAPSDHHPTTERE